MSRTSLAAIAAIAAMTSTTAAQTRTFGGEITAGSITAFTNNIELGAHFDLAGPGFRIVGRTSEPGRLTGPNPCATFDVTCVSGNEVGLSAFFISGTNGFLIGSARVTVNGETLENAQVHMLLFTLQAEPVEIPNGNRKNLVLSAPFMTLSGNPSTGGTLIHVEVYTADQVWGQGPWAEGEITGDGVVTGFYERGKAHSSQSPRNKPIFYYVLRDVIYSFNE